MIPVTKPFMPPKEEYLRYLDQVWEREYLTNNGPLVRKLEKELRDYLKVSHISYVSNGTIALQIAIKTLELKGEDRKSTRLNSSHVAISYAVFCLKKKTYKL